MLIQISLVTLVAHLGLLFTVVWSSSNSKSPVGEEQVCLGTSYRLRVPTNRAKHYRSLEARYTNCTFVQGNLELTWIQDLDLDLSFLAHIREVTGYIFISHVDVRRIVFPNLRIIRGLTRFQLSTLPDDEFALLVMLSKMNTLEFPALRDILSGDVGVLNNYNLCPTHLKSINWDEIQSGKKARHTYVYNFTMPERQCPSCHSSCDKGCWGEGPDNCQKFSKVNCSPNCGDGRCFGLHPLECCHQSCAGGCTGLKASDCLACKNFWDNGECKEECPPLVTSNEKTNMSEPNPAGKYAYGAKCLEACAHHLKPDKGLCSPDPVF